MDETRTILIPDVVRAERERVARERFRSLRGLSADAPVTVGAREGVGGDRGDSIRRRRKYVFTDADMAALKREWARNEVNEDGVPLQDEFGDEETFMAYARHRAAGLVTILERKDSRPRSGADTPPSAVLSAGELHAEWADPATQREFRGDFQAYAAFRRAEARGAVQIVCNSPGVVRG